MLDALADEFGGKLPGADYELDPAASDRELAQALSLSGTWLYSGLIDGPPVHGKGKQESKLLRRAALSDLDRSRAVIRFLTHALNEYGIAYDRLTDAIADRLDFDTTAPLPVQYRAQTALRNEWPISDAEAGVLADAEKWMVAIREFAGDPEREVQTALAFRRAEAQVTASVYAIEMLLGEGFSSSQNAQDNSGYSNLSGNVKMAHIWSGADAQAFETMRLVGVY